jgi:putative membrane-bound dehydrogenase-like protein
MTSSLSAAEPGVPNPLKVLFLGNKGHRASDRAAQLIPVMAGRGINITYTEDLDTLNLPNLSRYDVLMLYGNIDTISPAQEEALLAYVRGGGGFVPIHCASFCFRNSPAYIALVGAQFLRHGDGEFDTKIVDPAHPIMKGFEPFRTRDETYVHHKHNETGRHVLQVREEGKSVEPWTWVRTEGRGRVFYTAYGHDARTWGEPGFQALIERGLRWAAGRSEVFDSRPKPVEGLKPFTYVPAGSPIPNYLVSSTWGHQGEPHRRMQEPASPAESMRHMVVPRGFEVRLFAAEPDIIKPICMAWDHRGRLWIAESLDYPNDRQPEGKGHDRIKICEDTDGDGRADRFTVFAEGLSIPTSLAFARGGVVVQQAPETLFLKDNDGDDRTDVRQVLLSGWGLRDSHAGPSNLRWGLDNWLWGIVGYSGFEGRVGGKPLRFLQGIYRFRPDGSELEFLRSTNNNSWGLGFSEEGLVFGSTANGCPSVYLPIPNRYYDQVRGASAGALQSIASSYRFYPLNDKVRQVDWHGGFTAGAGHALYTARAYPPQYWNSTAFVAEPTGHLVATFTLQRRGSDVASYNGWNLVASDDEWSAPIVAEVGPDGQVWVIDWYNYIVQHNPTPKGFTTGQGNAYVTPLRDRTHGRIYRVVAQNGSTAPTLALDPDNGPQLVAALRNDNQFWRMHAQRLLVERGRRDVEPALIQLVQDRTTDEIGLNPAAIHALWTLHGLGALADSSGPAATSAVTALRHPSAGVRRNALAVLPRHEATTQAILEAGSLQDPDAQVRLAALLALAEVPPGAEPARALVEAVRRGLVDHDRWLTDAAIIAGAHHDRDVLLTLAKQRDGAINPTLLSIAGRVVEHWAHGGPSEQVGAMLAALRDAPNKRLVTVEVAGWVRGWPRDRTATLVPAAEAALAQLWQGAPIATQSALIRLAERWGSHMLRERGEAVAAALTAAISDATKADSERIEAATALVALRPDDPAVVRPLVERISAQSAPGLAAGWIAALSQSEVRDVGGWLLQKLGSWPPSLRMVALRTILNRPEWTSALLDSLQQGEFRASELALDQRQALLDHPQRRLAARAREILRRSGGLPDPDRQKVIDALASQVLQGGDATRGQAVYQRLCAQCHRHGTIGAQVGPDLTGMAAHPRDELLIQILDPARNVEGNYVVYTLATRDGRVLQGLLAAESQAGVEILDAEGKRYAVARSEIDELIGSKKSLMPEGFEKQMTTAELADVLAFLSPRGTVRETR